MSQIEQLPKWSDDPAAYGRAWIKRKRQLDPKFARRQSEAARAWQRANPTRNAFNQYRQGARRRGLVWDLTADDFARLALGECHYCGALPGEGAVNGVDRIDNCNGYVRDNVVTACAQCNYAKRDHTLEDFLAWARRLVDFQEGRNGHV